MIQNSVAHEDRQRLHISGETLLLVDTKDKNEWKQVLRKVAMCLSLCNVIMQLAWFHTKHKDATQSSHLTPGQTSKIPPIRGGEKIL